MQTFTSQQLTLKSENLSGLLLAITILSLWVISLVGLLWAPLSTVSLGWIILAVLGRTFLQTGLFVIAHDAMHVNLSPYNKRLNDIMGTVAVSLYACLPYQQCCINHRKHHQHPAQIGDPDFHDGIHDHPVLWYLTFLKSYLSVRSISLLLLKGCLLFWGLSQLFQMSVTHLMLFWGLPLILSSIQLFFFGTYLPHRQEFAPSNTAHPMQSSQLLVLWSLLSCYHFGFYHWEHHQYPKTPWYRLPTTSVSKNLLAMQRHKKK
ncbi:fatty acid desaturase [Allocoleopsis sp.]|uniref:fatty acid desaturase n=1 Tax=Allocoleopsis sp. TaxID=3088169 RepID=UPI002FD24074